MESYYYENFNISIYNFILSKHYIRNINLLPNIRSSFVWIKFVRILKWKITTMCIHFGFNNLLQRCETELKIVRSNLLSKSRWLNSKKRLIISQLKYLYPKKNLFTFSANPNLVYFAGFNTKPRFTSPLRLGNHFTVDFTNLNLNTLLFLVNPLGWLNHGNYTISVQFKFPFQKYFIGLNYLNLNILRSYNIPIMFVR